MRQITALAALASGAAMLSCISDRAEVTGPSVAGECRIDVGSGAVGTTLVAIRSFAFHPATLRVPAGTTVTWMNCEPAARNITIASMVAAARCTTNRYLAARLRTSST